MDNLKYLEIISRNNKEHFVGQYQSELSCIYFNGSFKNRGLYLVAFCLVVAVGSNLWLGVAFFCIALGGDERDWEGPDLIFAKRT